jgi:uncharacterized repeat protein (TIGR01451 family)
MKFTIKQSIAVWFLLVLLALPFGLSGCGAKTADLKITNTADKTTVSVGDNVTYTITLTNSGSVNTTNVAVTDDWATSLTYVSNNTDKGTYDSSTGIWTVANLDANASAKLTITATVAGKAGVLIIDNIARVSHVDQPDNNMYKQIAGVSIKVQSADLTVTNTVDNITPNEQDTINYTITLTNNGPVDATGVVVSDYLPPGVTYISSNADGGSYDTADDNWNVGNIADGATLTLVIKAKVNKETGALKIDNNPSVIYADQPDSNLNNNTATASLTVNGSDLSISNAEDSAAPKEGGTVNFTVTVVNNGPLDDTGVTATAVVPPGLTYVSNSPDQGTYDPATGIWTVGNIANGVTLRLNIEVTVNAGTAKQKISFNVSITHGDQPDGSTSDNTSSTLVMVGSS